MKETLAFVAAGVAAVVARLVLRLVITSSTHAAPPSPDPLWVQLVTGFVFFAVLIVLDPSAFKNDATADAGTTLDKGEARTTRNTASFSPKATPEETSAEMARIFAGVTDDASRRRAIVEWLHSVPRFT